MFSMFANLRRPRSRREQGTHPELPYYRLSDDAGCRTFNDHEASQGLWARAARAMLLILMASLNFIKTWLCQLTRLISFPLRTENDFPYMQCPSMDEVERLVADRERAQPGSHHHASSSSKTAGVFNLENRMNSNADRRKASLSTMSYRYATTAEILLWAKSMRLGSHFRNLKKAVIHHKHKNGDAVRQVAITNHAYRSRRHGLHEGIVSPYPQRITGSQVKKKLRLGPKGLKRAGDLDIPADKDVYEPKNGVSRKLENRPPTRGYWYYPQPSSLRVEFKPE
ncbi:hypothetical protein IWZ01DRAFT_481731 [Phyllosticta capitalensis]